MSEFAKLLIYYSVFYFIMIDQSLNCPMSYCTSEGQNKAVFLTEEDYEKPGMLYTLTINENEWGIILPTGDINWKCPCLGGITDSSCSQEFKDAFSCFHYSQEEIKGSECIEYFRKFQNCVENHSEEFGDMNDDVEEGEEGLSLDKLENTKEGQIELLQEEKINENALVPK